MQNTMLAAGPATHQATDPGGGHIVPGHNVAAMGKSASPHSHHLELQRLLKEPNSRETQGCF